MIFVIMHFRILGFFMIDRLPHMFEGGVSKPCWRWGLMRAAA